MFHLILLLTVPAALAQKCTFDNLSTYSPIITDADLTLPSLIEYEKNEKFYITCPEFTSSPFIAKEGDWVMCDEDTSILIIRTMDIVDFFELDCIPMSDTVVKKTDQKCENNGTIIQIGPQILDVFIPEVTVCLDKEKLTPFYTKYESKPLFNVDPLRNLTYEEYFCGTVRPCMFTDSSDIYGHSLDMLYHDQALILEKLGVDVPDHKLVKFPLSQDLFAHKLPQDIQNYASWQHVQTVPFWNNKCLIGSWAYYYTYYHSPIYNSKYTGSLEVATLPNSNNDPVELYLTGKQIPVPKWVWMVDHQYQAVHFIYNTFEDCEGSGFSDRLRQEASNLCKSPGVYMNLVTCFFVDVTHPELKEFIETQFGKNASFEEMR